MLRVVQLVLKCFQYTTSTLLVCVHNTDFLPVKLYSMAAENFRNCVLSRVMGSVSFFIIFKCLCGLCFFAFLAGEDKLGQEIGMCLKRYDMTFAAV